MEIKEELDKQYDKKLIELKKSVNIKRLQNFTIGGQQQVNELISI